MIHENQIVLNRGEYTSCSINIQGATVTSWRIHHQEQLFVSRQSQFSPLWHIRGGISFVFPHFGTWSRGPRHGFARDLAWSLEKGPEKLETGDVFVSLALIDDAFTHSLFSYKFKLSCKITLCEQKLIFNIYLENPCKYFPFEFDIMQHSLFRVPDVRNCKIIGLQNCALKKHVKDSDVEVEEREFITISEWTDVIYTEVPCEVILTDMMNGGTLKITRTHTYDINIWNPWEEGAKEIADLGDDEYQYFASAEAGILMKPIRLEPLSCWQARHIYEIIPKKDDKGKQVTDFYDLFNNCC